MKRFIFLLLVFCLIVPEVSSISSTIRDVYSPRETIVAEITGGILTPIRPEQIKIVRERNLDVAVQLGVGKLGNKHFIWMGAPSNPGNYSLIIRDVVALVNGVPEVTEYRKDFSVQGQIVDFSIVPGFVLANEDFRITVNAYIETDVQIDFPEPRTVHLYPGTNYVDFSIEKVLGTQQTIIKFGRYQIPAYIVGKKYICGDGRIDDREVCDGTNLNGKTCANVPGGFVSGQLRCASSCLAFDTALCEISPIPSQEDRCDEAHLRLCLNERDCTRAGGYWYNNSCNRYEQGAICDSQHVEICFTQGTCLDAGGYWYNNSCNRNASAVCGQIHPELCLTAGTCLDAGGYWYNNSCNRNASAVCGDGIVTGLEECDGNNLRSKNCTSLGYDGGDLKCIPKNSINECKFNLTACFLIPPPEPPAFIIEPSEIKSVVFLSRGFPVYKFKIVNNGSEEIVGMRLEFNPSKFAVSPNRDINISVNRSASFNLTVKDVWRGTPFKGVVIAYVDEVHEYLFLEFNFTDIESEAITKYSRSSNSNDPSYYCSELSGIECGSEQTCEGNVVVTIDKSQCCIGTCSGSGNEGSWRWIGYLIAGIVLIIIVFVFMKYKKAGNISGSPLQSRINLAKKNLP